MQFLGIDGGGTKTAFVLTDDLGNVLAQTIEGTIHIRQIDLSELKDRLIDGMEELSRQLGSKIQPDYTFIAMPGFGEFKDDNQAVLDILSTIFTSGSYSIGNDSVAGWASMGTRPGVNLVLGTGAIAYGRDDYGNEARTSGWGPFCGDEGSAYWLGKKLIELFTKQSDGRATRGKLYDIVKSRLELNNDFDFIDYVSRELGEDRTKIATLSKLLFESALQGDKDAISAYEFAAYEGANAVIAVIQKLKFKSEIYIGFSGGVFRSGDLILNPLKSELLKYSDKYDIRFVDQTLSPSKGAALLAMKEYGTDITDEIIKQWLLSGSN